ncbi:MAG TPA: dethiobiotin synthase [Planctomycetaceae bacterium]|nr:dethiobiotin synthase [Planctomycetaceae bacterium]
MKRPIDELPTGLFFVGTDTDVGKTYCAAELLEILQKRGLKLGAYKPCASGVVVQDSPQAIDIGSDAFLLCKAAGLELSLMDRVCPQSFYAPLAPPIAAALESRTVDQDRLVAGATWWNDHCQFLLVEGAGGILSPITESWTVADLAVKLQLPLVLVAANRLGCVSQVLAAAEAIANRSLRLHAVILNAFESEVVRPAAHHLTPIAQTSDRLPAMDYLEITHRTNHQLIEQFLPGIPILKSARQLASLIEC